MALETQPESKWQDKKIKKTDADNTEGRMLPLCTGTESKTKWRKNQLSFIPGWTEKKTKINNKSLFPELKDNEINPSPQLWFDYFSPWDWTLPPKEKEKHKDWTQI